MKRYTSHLPYPFSQAVEVHGIIYLSGLVSMDRQGQPVYGDINEQTHQVMKSIQTTLTNCGSALNKIVKVTVWLSDMRHFAAFNQVYASYFSGGFPARTTVVSQLAFDLDVEIEVQALA
ncbi:MAG: 2-iminobutanoate/2-iminopropanoate deaminase [Candidatus Erwinia impunctatus]|nr:2-iminobutanoate/2-iminopropanoate deaminase [Culicoides impunctatus]